MKVFDILFEIISLYCVLFLALIEKKIQDVAHCVTQRKEGLFHRKKPVVDQSKYYNAEQKSVLKAMRDEVYKKIGIKNSKPF